MVTGESAGKMCIRDRIINNLLENNEERKRIAKNGHRTILEQWPSWEERVRDEVDLVEKLAGNKVGV